MGDDSYRVLADRMDSPNRHLPIEHLVDTRLCVSSLTTQQCYQLLRQLDDHQVKNAVFDRALCFPFDQWTDNIRKFYAKQVQNANRAVISFENVSQMADRSLSKWKNHVDFGEADLCAMETLVKCHLAPSIDNLGVYATFSDYTVTKINGLSALLKIGQILVEIPIITSPRGRALFTYDPLSRAVASILSTAINRGEILDLGMESDFMDLAKRSDEVGLFPGLVMALLPGAQVRPYNVPLGEPTSNNMNKRASDGLPGPVAKKSKVAQLRTYRSYLEEGLTPGSSQASSEQPRGVTEGWATESSEPQNPFSRPPSAGPISPPFSKRAPSPPAGLNKAKNHDIEGEQAQGSSQREGEELQGIAREATEHQPKLQDFHQAIRSEQAQHEQVPARDEASVDPEGQQVIASTEEQGAQQPDQIATETVTEEATGIGEGEDLQHFELSPYDEMLRRVENEMFQAHINESPDAQLAAAPAGARLVEETCNKIMQNLSRVAVLCKASGSRNLFLRSLNDTVFALLWLFESCALNVGGTPFTAEVSRTLTRDTLIGSLWGAIRMADQAEWIDLLDVEDSLGNETFAGKLERIIRRMDETDVVGYGSLQFVLSNMRAGIAMLAHGLTAQDAPA
ncbi:hypothetical protein Daus18300_000118 [Diaporthe australafricana]|uniref:Uncharacterized protein n=1 Tax=Diaporthe australafricana TaxID=127596 RepID=A0ABR3Y7K0_9PEZI